MKRNTYTKPIRTVVEMNTGTKVIRSKKDKSKTRAALKRALRNMY